MELKYTCIYLNRRHGNRDMKIFSIINSFHHGNAVRTFNILCRILASGNKDGRDNIAGMSIETPQGSRNSWPSKVLNHVQLHQGRHGGLEDCPDHLFLDNCLTNNRFATSLNPVNCSGLLVWTKIAYRMEGGKSFERAKLKDQKKKNVISNW